MLMMLMLMLKHLQKEVTFVLSPQPRALNQLGSSASSTLSV